jgi:hypothetical protein
MDTILVSIISLALIIVSTLTVTLSSFKSANRMADAWKMMEERSALASRTDIATVAPPDYRGGLIDLTVRNDGHVNLSDFNEWDVIVQDQSGVTSYLLYSPTYPPAAGQWALNGIFVTEGIPEVFDRNILNPGERMTVSIAPVTEVGVGQMARVLVSTPSGVTSQCFVTRR